MTRQEYIEAVKVKLEEISPFAEPESFIAADGDADYSNVKPIVSYIDKTLDEAGRNCLRSLPLSLLHADIQIEIETMTISDDGVGTFTIDPSCRFVRLHNILFARDITEFITTEDPLYLLQQRKWTRGKTDKPVAVISSNVNPYYTGMPPRLLGYKGIMEVYSFPQKILDIYFDEHSPLYNVENYRVHLYYIDTTKTPGSTNSDGSTNSNPIKSDIEEYIVLECAAMVSDILGNVAAAQMCRQELQSKI